MESSFMRQGTLELTFFALFCGMLLLSTDVLAQSAQNTSTQSIPSIPKAKPFGISAAISKSLSLVDFKDGERQESNDLEVIPSYKWSLGNTMAVFTFSDDVRHPGNSDIGDIAIATAFKPWDFPRFKVSSSFTFVIPQSKESRLNKNLETSISGKITAGIHEKLLIPGYYLKGIIGFGRNIHRYETAVDGSVLNKYSSKQGISTGYSFGIFSLDFDFTHVHAWSYQGTLKESYDHSEEASVAIGDRYAFAFGHTNSGSVFKDDGYTSNYQLIDENNSLVYAKVSMQY